MSVSRYQSDTPAGKPRRRKQQEDDRDKQPAPDKQQGQDKQGPQPETPLWEKLAGLLGLLLVLGVLGFLVYEGIQPRREAEIVTEVQSIAAQPGGYVVTIEASNRGRQSAAAVLIEGALYDPAGGEEPVETAEMTFDYIPDQSDRTGSLIFERDPAQYDLRLQVKGFMDP